MSPIEIYGLLALLKLLLDVATGSPPQLPTFPFPGM